VCSFADGPLRQKIENTGTRVELIAPPRCTVTNPLRYFLELKRIRQELLGLATKYAVELIQTHILGPYDFVALNLRGRNKVQRVLWTMHGVDFLPARPGRFLGLRRSVVRLLYVLFVKKADALVAVSGGVRQSIMDNLGSGAGDRIVVINNGVDVMRFQQPANSNVRLKSPVKNVADCCRRGDPIILTVGRLAEEKGHCYLIQAVPEVLKAHPNAHFVFAGSGPIEKQLRDLAVRTEHAENIHFPGFVDNIPELLGVADIFVLPSLREGMPIALLEAMAAGLPVVATNIAGTEEVIDSSDVGVLVLPRNVGALAKAISSFLECPESAAASGAAAKQRVTTAFSAERQALEYDALYSQLLD